MRLEARHFWVAVAIAVGAHLALVHAVPRVLMEAAMERLSQGRLNAWVVAERVTPELRQIVRPSPDFAYSACVYDLSRGPVSIRVAPWEQYWSLSLYAANSDNYYVVDDREARQGQSIVLARRRPRDADDRDAAFVKSPSTRGIALIRRLAPTVEAHAAAVRAAQGDVCARGYD